MRDFNWIINKAYIRDGDLVVHGEGVLLACLLHTKGAGRDTKDMEDVQAIMLDHNREAKRKNK